jgi:hypothetical protein
MMMAVGMPHHHRSRAVDNRRGSTGHIHTLGNNVRHLDWQQNKELA